MREATMQHKIYIYIYIEGRNGEMKGRQKIKTIACAYKCFSSIIEPDLISWTSMINAYVFHGLAKEANEMFEKMLSCGIRPDKISFLGVLSACAHCRLVMTSVYHLLPETEHYACLVDLLGRCGLIY